MNTNEKRNNLYKQIINHFNSKELTKDGLIINIEGQKVAIKVTMKKNFNIEEKASFQIPYKKDAPEFLELCECIRKFYRLENGQEIIFSKREPSRYWRDYHASLNHNIVPKNLIPTHLWNRIPIQFQEKIIEEFGDWSNGY